MNALEVGKKLVELCNQGKAHEAHETLYAPDIISIEASAPPGQSREAKGHAAVAAKSQWWAENHTIHSAVVDGPWPHDDQFIVRFTYEVTFKPANRRFTMEEAALYTVANGKITSERFFYTTG